MDYRYSEADSQSPELQSNLLEPILLHCIGGCMLSDLVKLIQSMLLMPLSFNTTKQYLYHLINYELVSYDGKRKIFITKNDGLDLLSIIHREKKMAGIKSEDLIITLD